MLMATSVCSILLVAAHTRWAARIAPPILVPASFVGSGLLFVCEWLIRATPVGHGRRRLPAHLRSGTAAGVRLLADRERALRSAHRKTAVRADRRCRHARRPARRAALRARRGLGRPDDAPRPRRLPVRHRLAGAAARAQLEPVPTALEAEGTSTVRSGLRVVADAPHLHHLAALVLLGTTSAALVEYLFKARAVETFGPGDQLLRFFALYYAATSLITFVLQTLSSRSVLERFGLGLTTSTPSIALLAGSVAGLLAPGFGSLLVARGAESIFRGSWFRAGYELFYTPIPAAEKRAAKSVIDVAFDRLGDAVGGGLVRLAVLLTPRPVVDDSRARDRRVGGRHRRRQPSESLVRPHARKQPRQAGRRPRPVAYRRRLDANGIAPDRHDADRAAGDVRTGSPMTAPGTLEPDLRRHPALRSRHRDRIVEVLSREEGLGAALVPHVIPLLACDPLADYALFALRKVAEERVGELTDALLDPNQEPRSAAAWRGCFRSASPSARPTLCAGARRCAVRRPLPVRAIAGVHPRQESDRPRRRRGGLRGGPGRGDARTGSGGPEPRPRLHAAVAGAAERAAADCLSQPARRR